MERSDEAMRKVSKEIIDLLKSYNFRINKQTASFYKSVKIKNRTFKIRLSDHFKHKDFKGEILLNYVYKNEKDFYRVFNKIIKKYNIKGGVNYNN